MKIAEKTYVAIDYVLTLDSGKEVDRSQEGTPLGFITGSGQIIPGLEKQLVGMEKGQSAKLSVEAEDGYGLKRDDLFQDVPLDQFPKDEEIQPGMSFQAQGPHGPFMIVVQEVKEDAVVVDLNHPLAGERLHFDITVAEVREPSESEVAQFSGGCACGSDTGSNCGSDSGSGCNCG